MRKKSWLKTTFVTVVGASLILIPATFAQSETIPLSLTDISPESLVYNPSTQTFLVSSTAKGAIYEVALDGTTTPFIEDASLKATIGLYLDTTSHRLYVVNSNLALMVGQGNPFGGNGQPPANFDPSQLPSGFPTLAPGETPQFPGNGQPPANFDPSQLPQGFTMPDFGISLLVFDVTSKEKLLEVVLTDVAPQGIRFANDVAVDADGNAYVTDSLSGAIYRVDPQGNTAYLSSDQFGAQGLGLNGIVFKEGYLLINKTSDGSLYKIDLADPANVMAVQLSDAITGADGMSFDADGNLVIVAGQVDKIYTLTSADNWASATVTARDVASGATDVTFKDGKEYVLSGGLRAGFGQPSTSTDSAEQTPAQILGY